MNLLIDVGAIKTGGGVQLALNFLDLLSEHYAAQKVILLAPKTGPLASYAFNENQFTVYRYPNNYVARFWFELTQLKLIIQNHRITHFYTFFGAGLPHTNAVKSVVTTAYPTICYPDSLFWRYSSTRTYLKNHANNLLRRYRLRSADKIVVETEVMKQRISRYVPFPKERIEVLPPVPSRYLPSLMTRRISADTIQFVLLSGCDPHKNLWRLPEIALELNRLGAQSFRFCVSTSEVEFLTQPRINLTAWSLVRDRFQFLGRVDSREIGSVYESANFLVNLSDLESFSNNYMEAWKAGVPIIASDRDFARFICEDSAVYVEPHSAGKCARAIVDLVNDPEKQRLLLAAASAKLQALGEERTRFRAIMEILAAA